MPAASTFPIEGGLTGGLSALKASKGQGHGICRAIRGTRPTARAGVCGWKADQLRGACAAGGRTCRRVWAGQNWSLVQAANSEHAIVAYLAALHGGHAVALLSPCDPDALEALKPISGLKLPSASPMAAGGRHKPGRRRGASSRSCRVACDVRQHGEGAICASFAGQHRSQCASDSGLSPIGNGRLRRAYFAFSLLLRAFSAQFASGSGRQPFRFGQGCHRYGLC